MIEAALGHQEQNEIRRAYNRASYWPERIELMNNAPVYSSDPRINLLRHTGNANHIRFAPGESYSAAC